MPIGFALDTGSGGINLVDLSIRPEELTRVDPFRVTAMNTLDGAWVDSFGSGLGQLTISGHTGWGQGSRPSGVAAFLALRDLVKSWGGARGAAAAQGVDPASVRMLFSDSLNGSMLDVVPMQFTMKRSKSNPLLIYYNISMIIIGDRAAGGTPGGPAVMAGGGAGGGSAAVASIAGSVDTINRVQSSVGGALSAVSGMAAQAMNVVNSVVLPAVNVATTAINAVGAVRQALSLPALSAIGVAANLSSAASRLVGTVQAVSNLPVTLATGAMQIQSALTNISTNLSNGFGGVAGSGAVGYSNVYGASSMSDVAGGLPPSVFSAVNTFQSISNRATQLISASQQAVGAISQLRNLDVTQPVDQPQIMGLATQIQSGVEIV